MRTFSFFLKWIKMQVVLENETSFCQQRLENYPSGMLYRNRRQPMCLDYNLFLPDSISRSGVIKEQTYILPYIQAFGRGFSRVKVGVKMDFYCIRTRGFTRPLPTPYSYTLRDNTATIYMKSFLKSTYYLRRLAQTNTNLQTNVTTFYY